MGMKLTNIREFAFSVPAYMEMASSISVKIYDSWVVDTNLPFTPKFHDIISTVWMISLIFLCYKDYNRIKLSLSKQPISLLTNDFGGDILMFLGVKDKLIFFFYVKTI